MIPISVSFAAQDRLTSIWTGPLILKKVNRPDLETLRHKENSLKLWVFEAKRLPSKKKYFCEICLNHILYARTTSKSKTQDADPFWGEPFEFSNLQEISLVTVKLFREADRKKKKDRNQLIGEVYLPVHQILNPTEQWYTVGPPHSQPSQQLPQLSSAAKQSNSGNLASLRLKCRYLSVDVLPLSWYASFADFLSSDYKAVVRLLEPRLPVRMKEDLACGLVALAQSRRQSELLVADLLLQELDACGGSEASALVVFRGNSIATKSVEYYLKLVGSDYLRSVLAEPVSILLRSNESCEVDPARAASSAELESNQRSLRLFAELFWTRIYTSADRLPPEFGRLFAGIRAGSSQRLCDQLVGASIFLRFICPAILGPSLFGLCQELPPAPAARSLTLIAKTVQNLANGASFGGKEAYMNFMNRFLDQHHANMAQFVSRLQTASHPALPGAGATSATADSVDPGFELAQLHTLLSAALDLGPKSDSGVAASHPCLATLAGHLTTVTACLKNNCPPPPVHPPAALTPGGTSSGGDLPSGQYSNGAGPAPVRREQRSTAVTPVSSPSAPSGHPSHLHHQPQQQQAQPDWHRVLLNHSPLPSSSLHAIATAAAAGSATEASAVSSATGGSSGYHSFTHRQPTGDSPVQFLNPSYQKSAADLVLPDRVEPAPGGGGRVASSHQRHAAAVPAGRNGAGDDQYSSTSSSDEADTDEDDGEDVNVDGDDSSSAGASNTSPQRNFHQQMQSPQPPPPLPPHRVRMGLSSVQQQQRTAMAAATAAGQQQQPPASMESPTSSLPSLTADSSPAMLHQLQVELSLTRRQLEDAETKLRSHELEKTRLMAQFERGALEHERREAENGRQLADIMARLQALEADFRGAPANRH